MKEVKPYQSHGAPGVTHQVHGGSMEATSTTSSTASSVDGRSTGGGASDYLNLGMFAAGVGAGQQGDLLSGGAGFGGISLGNGFGNDASTTPPGTSFDLSDFPSLGGGAPNSSTSAAGSGGLAAALRQQQQLLAHQQHMMGSATSKSNNLYRLAMTGTNGNFNMATEDFPALSGGANASGTGSTGGSALNAASSLLASSASRGQSNGGLYGGSGDLDNVNSQLDASAGGLLGGTGLGGLGGLRGLQQPSNSNPSLARAPSSGGPSAVGAVGSSSVTGASGSAAGNALNGDYGLLGLLGVIRMTDADRNALALGSDLTMLGLNLGSTEQIYSTFSSPWTDGVVSKEPHYQLPMCYYMQPPALKTGHLSKFQLETLFYIFYALPKDVLQAYAAQELYSREWRYHGELKLWFKRAGPSDGVANVSAGSTQYLYFDINSWERRLFNGNMQNIASGFLSEDEVRVKFPSS